MDFPALLHSVSYSGTWGQEFLPLDRFVDKAAALGYDGVMLMAKRPHLSVLDYGVKERFSLRDAIERRGLRHVCVAGYNNFNADAEHGDIPQNELQICYITELAKLTADLGGETLRVFTGYEQRGAAFATQWNQVVSALKECCKRAADFGVTIGVQNHHDIGVEVESQYQLIQAIDEPNCKALFDAWAPALHGADLNAAARRMAPVTAHTTAANYQMLPRYQYQKQLTNYTALEPWLQAVPVNEGFIDYQEFLTTLHASGFRGTVAYEMCSPLRSGGSMESLDDYARQFIDFIARLRMQVRTEAVLA